MANQTIMPHALLRTTLYHHPPSSHLRQTAWLKELAWKILKPVQTQSSRESNKTLGAQLWHQTFQVGS